MADGLSTKMLDIIANSSSRALSKPWIPLAIEQMRMFSKNKGIFLPEHILLCNLDIKNITATSKSYDPFIIGALRDWSSMGYTRKIMSDDYEEIASLPIWLNPRLLIDGKLIKLREGTFRGIKSKTLYHKAQLFTNFNATLYHGGNHIVPSGIFKTNSALNSEYVNPTLPISDNDWNKLKQAVTENLTSKNVSWRLARILANAGRKNTPP